MTIKRVIPPCTSRARPNKGGMCKQTNRHRACAGLPSVYTARFCLAMDDLVPSTVDKTGNEEDRTIVRLRRSWWFDKKGACERVELRFIARQSAGFNVFHDDCQQLGAEGPMRRIVNLAQSPDGVYQLAVCNERRDWETGYIEDWDYKLVALPTPYAP